MTEAGLHIEQQRIQALRRYHVLDTAPDERFDRITHMVSQIFRVPIAIISLIDEHRQWFKSRVGILAPETARDIAFCNTTIAGQDALVVEDTAEDPRFAKNPLVIGPLKFRFYAGVPLRSSEGQNIGTLAIIADKPRQLEAWEIRTLSDLAEFVMSELELWRRLHELQTDLQVEVTEALARGQFERELAARRFRGLVEFAPEITLQFERDGRLLYASPSLQRVTGYGPAEVFGKPVFSVFAEEDLPTFTSCLTELLNHPGGLRSGNWSLRHRDGQVLNVVATVQNLFGDPAIASFVMHARDVTAETHARKELERTREMLRQAERMEAVGRFASGIAHDFNNLLTVVFSSVDLAARSLPSDAPAQQDLADIAEASQRAATMVRKILTFCHDRPPSVKSVDVNMLIEGAMPLLLGVVGNIKLEFKPCANLPHVKVDGAQIEHVLMNLCANARDAIAGAGSISISTSVVAVDNLAMRGSPWVQPGHCVAIVVADTGSGMAPEVVEHAFEPFFTTKQSGKGTGLGLATSYGTIRQHGGFMNITSTPGKGTEVRVVLPAIAQA